MKVEDILKNAPSNISKDMLMRYIYLELGKMYRRDVNFFYGTDEEKAEIYNRKFKLDTSNIDVICKSIGEDIYVKVFEQAGIRAKCVNKPTNSPFPHVDIVASPDEGKHWYYMNPLDDLYRIQGGLKTQRFGTQTSKYEGLDYYTEEQLREMDNTLGYTYNGMYMDEFFDVIREEFMNRAKIKRHILEARPDITRKDLTKDFYIEYKMDFIMQHIAEFQRMQGYIELKKYQKEIFGRVLTQVERGAIKIHNLCNLLNDKTNMKSVIEVCLSKGHIYYITEKGTSEYKKLTAEQMIEYMENEEWHFLKEKKNLEQPEETK